MLGLDRGAGEEGGDYRPGGIDGVRVERLVGLVSMLGKQEKGEGEEDAKASEVDDYLPFVGRGFGHWHFDGKMGWDREALALRGSSESIISEALSVSRSAII